MVSSAKLDDGVAGVGGGAVMGVEGVKKGTQHTALGEPLLRLRHEEEWRPTLTFCGRSDRKSLITDRWSEIFPGLTVWLSVCRGGWC